MFDLVVLLVNVLLTMSMGDIDEASRESEALLVVVFINKHALSPVVVYILHSLYQNRMNFII